MISRGVLFALAAYGLWGVFPVYWKALSRVPLIELLAHRAWLSSVFAIALVVVSKRAGAVGLALRDARVRRALAASTVLIATNWGLFIYTVQVGDIAASSLGYFLNPLVNVALGVAFLRERLRPLEAVAVGIALLGVLALAAASGGLPWLSLALALTFGVYGLLRKLAPVAPIISLAVETTLLAPLAIGVIAFRRAHGIAGAPALDPIEWGLLAGSGVATGIPLLCFAAAASRLRLGTLGLFQYLAPSLQLALAVVLYGEPFPFPRRVAFGCVWLGLAIYTADQARARRETARAARASIVESR